MKWFNNWFSKKCREAWENSSNENRLEKYATPVHGMPLSSSGSHSRLDSRHASFNIYNASGGFVIEVKNYDDKVDRWENSLHVVPKGKSLSKSIDQILLLEALKR